MGYYLNRKYLQANSRRGGSRARKGKANEVLAAETSAAEDEEQYGSDFDWEAEHEAVDWSNNPAECILAVTMKGKYVVKRKGMTSSGVFNCHHASRQCMNICTLDEVQHLMLMLFAGLPLHEYGYGLACL